MNHKFRELSGIVDGTVVDSHEIVALGNKHAQATRLPSNLGCHQVLIIRNHNGRSLFEGVLRPLLTRYC